MPTTTTTTTECVTDDQAVRKIQTSDDKAFVLRAFAAAKSRLEEMNKSADPNPADGKYRPLGDDTAANPGK